ncbi:MAG: hypothetical protein QHH27_06265 [Clostridia bacterium]|nr:hypothetical protein [Clostridia bacterium]MDH7573139.1 hypothetical protein [Clostridia bacterium]
MTKDTGGTLGPTAGGSRTGRRDWLWRRRAWLVALEIAVLALLLWYLRTWWHAPLMFCYTHPAVFEALAIWLALHFLWFRRRWTGVKIWEYEKKDDKGRKTGERGQMRFRTLWLSYWVVLPVLLIFLPLLAQVARQLDIVSRVEYHRIERLPDATANLRLMPEVVARRYARDALQLSQYKLGTEHIARINGKLCYTFPLVPDGLVLVFTAKNAGMAYVDATTQERNSQMVWKQMRIGEGMKVTDSLWWNLFRVRYWVNTEETYYIPKDGEIYTVAPAIAYDYGFRWGLVYAVPVFAGSFVVDTQGHIALVPPAEALSHPVLQDNLIFPEHLARTYVDAYQYKNGVINRFFLHRDQIEIQDVGENKQPFLLDTAEGLKWFISTEPYGQSHGIFKIFLVDARTGRIELFELPEDQVLTGPIRALDYVRRANPLVDWSLFNMVEPLPVVKEGVLYWKTAVIPQDYAGVAYQAFVDSRNNSVVELETDAEVAAFLAGRPVPPSGPAGAVPEAREDLVRQIQQKLEEIERLLEQLKAREDER